MVNAIVPNNAPNPIPGAINGEMDPRLLVYVDPNCMAYGPAATSLERLITTAREAGISLGTNQCYRPLANQILDRNSACASGNCACAAPKGTQTSGGTSMHGWGEAADLKDITGSINTFTSPTYAWLVQEAARFGWNHPGWAVPGNPCPEPWHWEWVGDGGRLGGPQIKADVVTLVPTGSGAGYRIVTGLGDTTEFGDAGTGTVASSLSLNRILVAGAAVPGGNGYWLASADGGVFSFGSAGFFGSAAPSGPISPDPAIAALPSGTLGSGPTIAAMAATPSGKGYWLLSTSGRIYNFGDAPGFTAPSGPNRYYVGLASSRSGKGLLLASSDGQVTALGDAHGFPTPAINRATDPVVAMAATPDGGGYWLVTANGTVYPAGDAAALGSIASPPAQPVVSMSSTPSGRGYWLVTASGSVYAFGDARYLGGS